jgi:hypothetical protein
MSYEKYGTFNGKVYDDRHGGPFDRGSADSYYDRPRNPHYYVGATGQSDRVLTLEEDQLEAYNAGYDWNEKYGEKKDWGYDDY